MELKIFRKDGKDELTALAVRMKKGDRRAASELYEIMMPKVYGFYFSRTGKKESAEDLAQDIFMKLVTKIDAFDEARGSFVVWFWQMARNMLIDHYREKRETAFSSFEDEEVESMAVAKAPDMDDRLRFVKVQTFLKTLGEDEQQLFELRYVAEMSYRDIEGILGRSEGSLRVASMRLKEKIKKAFHGEI